MKLGIFSKTYERATVEDVFAAVAADGLTAVQFNFVSAGLPPLPESIEPAVVARVRRAAETHDIAIASLSATFNLIHPDPGVVDDGLRRLETLAAVCAGLGTDLLTLCTGTRDPANMWHWHPGNALPDAWRDLLTNLRRAVAIADRYHVRLGIEPEPGNVVKTAHHAARLLAELPSPRLGIVLDPANVIDGLAESEVAGALDQAVALLATRTVLAHGKDRDATGQVVPAGRGIVPWPHLLTALRDRHVSGPLILHGLEEQDVPGAVTAITQALATS